MKKTFALMIAVFALSMVFSSCQKDMEGVYNPKKKISEISCITKYVYGGQNFTTGYRNVWTWDGNLLTSINQTSMDGSMQYSKILFRYDEKNRIEEMELLGARTYEYDYEDGKIAEINVYNSNGDYIGKYEFVHNGNKISEIIIDEPYASDKDALFSPLRFFFPEHTVEMMLKNASKGVSHYKFTWEGDNIIEQELTGAASATATYKRISYSYDKKINPYQGFYNLLGISNDAIYSANNPTRFVYHGDSEDQIVDYTYVYDGNYPVERSRDYIDGGCVGKYIEEFKYLD